MNERGLRVACAIGIVLLASLSRLLPHPPNFTPILALALFSGSLVKGRVTAVVASLGAMLISDLVVGLHGTMPYVYAAVAASALLGRTLMHKSSAASYVLLGSLSSLTFFMLSNLGVWLQGGGYAPTFEGLTACYVAAIPFFKNTLSSTLIYVFGIFYAHRFLESRLYSCNSLYQSSSIRRS